MNAGSDLDLAAAAEALIQAIKADAPETATALGVSIKDVDAANVRLGNIRSTGTGIDIQHGRFSGDLSIDNVTAGRFRQR